MLYGSCARGDARPDSDVDLLVVLRNDCEPYAELRRVGQVRLEVGIRYEVELSLQPYSAVEENSFVPSAPSSPTCSLRASASTTTPHRRRCHADLLDGAKRFVEAVGRVVA